MRLQAGFVTMERLEQAEPRSEGGRSIKPGVCGTALTQVFRHRRQHHRRKYGGGHQAEDRQSEQGVKHGYSRITGCGGRNVAPISGRVITH